MPTNPLILMANMPGGGAGGGGGGGGGGAVSIDNRSLSDIEYNGVTANCGYSLNNNGNAYDIFGSVLEVWRDSGVSSAYDVNVAISGDALLAGSDATGTWLNLGTTRTWSIRASISSKSTTLTVQIRNASTLTVLDTATINLYAETNVGPP